MSNRATRRKKSDWEDISDILTHQAMVELKAGQVLRFEKGDYKIMRMTPYKCWVKKVRLYHPDELEVVDKDNSGKTA